MSRKKFLFSILAVAMSLVCGSLLSSDTFAAQRIGNYTNFVTNFTGFPASSTGIRNNLVYTISGNSGNLWLANGEFNIGIDWVEGKTYHVSLGVSFNASNVNFVQPQAMHIDGNNYHSTNDTITSSVDCSSSSSCRYSVIHNIDIVATSTGNEVVKTPTSNIIDVVPSGNLSGSFEMSSMLFDDEDEWSAFKSDVSYKLNSISSNTEDTVDILSDIYSDTSSINRNLQSIVDAQEQANQDANDRYEDEKDTIDTNTSGGIDAVDDIDTTINLPNPLSFFLGSLSVNTCYDISTLASMVGSSTTTYCSWFSSNTRTIMTPFVDVFVFVIVSAFIWSWVKKGGL